MKTGLESIAAVISRGRAEVQRIKRIPIDVYLDVRHKVSQKAKGLLQRVKRSVKALKEKLLSPIRKLQKLLKQKTGE